MVLLDIETIPSCQQYVYKIITLQGDCYYYKKYINHQSWWTLNSEDLSEREYHVWSVFKTCGIPVAELESYSPDSFVTHEVKNTISAAEECSDHSHFEIGELLKKIHSINYIHGDFHHENILIDKTNGSVRAIIDFEESIKSDKHCKHLPRHLQPNLVYDLATFLISVKHFYPNTYENKWKEFMRGYGLSDYLLSGILDWTERIEERNQLFRKWADENKIENVIC